MQGSPGVPSERAIEALLRSWRARARGSTHLDSSSQGARALLVEAECGAERALHAARGLAWAALFGVYAVVFGVAAAAPWWTALGVIVFPAVWLWIWRGIGTGERRWLKYALILLDAYVAVVRPALYLAAPSSLRGWFGEFGVTAADLLAISPPWLVFLTLSGAFRLDPWAALFSTGVSLACWSFVSIVTGVASREAQAVGLVIALAGLIGIYMAGLLRQVALRARRGEVLEHYVPATLTDALERSGHPEHEARQAEVTLVMADIRDYTQHIEHLAPAEAIALLNRYHRAVVTPLVAEGAFIDDYVGDGLLAHFEGADRARRALRAALRMQTSVARLNDESGMQQPIRIGISVHAGSVLVGPVGAGAHRAYAIVGDAVNVAARLEKWNKDLGSTVIASASALEGIGDPAEFGFEGPHVIEVRGHDEPITAFHIPGRITS
jgi:class 3 adenylate cyclase